MCDADAALAADNSNEGAREGGRLGWATPRGDADFLCIQSDPAKSAVPVRNEAKRSVVRAGCIAPRYLLHTELHLFCALPGGIGFKDPEAPMKSDNRLKLAAHACAMDTFAKGEFGASGP